MAWGTKVTTVLPEPKGNNLHSFDRLFVFTNGAEGQRPSVRLHRGAGTTLAVGGPRSPCLLLYTDRCFLMYYGSTEQRIFRRKRVKKNE